MASDVMGNRVVIPRRAGLDTRTGDRIMLKKLGFILLLALAAGWASAQTTTVQLVNITDSDGTIWANGTWKIDFNPNPNTPGEGQYKQNGNPLNGTITHQQGSLSNVGSASFSVYDSSTITPVGSGWKLTVCPNASSPCGTYIFSTAGASMNVTSGVNNVIQAPRFTAKIGAYGYNSTEAQALNQPGATYWDVTQGCQNFYNPNTTTWACTSASGAIPAGPAFAVNFANNAVSNFQGDATFLFTPSTHSLVVPQIDGIKNAQSYQTGGGNNGIANALSSNAFVFADPTYATTEAQPFGGVNSYFYGVTAGPLASNPFAQFLDTRYGVPQWIFNESQLFDSRHNQWPAIVMNWEGNSGITGRSANLAGNLLLINNIWTGTQNNMSDKTNIEDLNITENKYASAQTGAGISHTLNGYGNGDQVNQVLENVSHGGPNAPTDEGSEIFRGGSFEAGTVFGNATVSSVTVGSDGTTTIVTNGQQNSSGGCLNSGPTGCGTQGERRYVIDLTNKTNTGYISSIAITSGDIHVKCAGGCNWDGVYGTSTKTILSAAIQDTGATNTFPRTNVTASVASSTGFTVGHVACFADYAMECEKITAVGTGTITVSILRTPHPANAYVTTDGLAGYVFEAEADRVTPGNLNGVGQGFDQGQIQNTIRVAIPIMYNITGNELVLAQGYNILPGGGGGYSGRAFTSYTPGTGGTCSVTVSGGAVTAVTVSGGTGWGSPTSAPPTLVISGITYTTAPQVYVTATSAGALTTAAILTAGSGIAGTPTCAVTASNPYDIYPAAMTYQVYNTTTGTIDGSFITGPWAGTINTTDIIEQPHYYLQHTAWDGPIGVGQYQPAQAFEAHSFGGGYISGIWQGNDSIFNYSGNSDFSLYQGFPSPVNIVGRGQLIPPSYFIGTTNIAVRRYLEFDTPPIAPGIGYAPAGMWIGCGTIGCANWNIPYYIIAMVGATQTDGHQFVPSTDTELVVSKFYDLTKTNVLLPDINLSTKAGLISGQGLNYAPNSNALDQAPWQNTGAGTGTTTCGFTDDYGNPACQIADTSGSFNWQDRVSGGYTSLTNGATYTTQVRLKGAVGGELVNVGGGLASQQFTITASWANYCYTYVATAPLNNVAAINIQPSQTVYASNVVTTPGTSCGPPATTANNQILTPTPVNQLPTLEVLKTLKVDGSITTPALTIGTLSGCLQATAGVVSGTGTACGTGTGGSGITQLTGDVLAGPGTGSVVATLPNVNANIGSFGDATHVAVPTVNAKGQITAITTTAITFPSGIANIQISIGSFAIPANTCYGSTGSTTPATAAMTGLATSSVPFASFSGNPSAITGWGTTGGLSLEMWPTANTLNYLICNATTASITGGAITFNVGAR